MANFQVKTPLLRAAADRLLQVLDGVSSGTMDIEHAKVLTVAAGKIPTVVAGDIKARLASPYLAEIESKPINGGASRAAVAAR